MRRLNTWGNLIGFGGIVFILYSTWPWCLVVGVLALITGVMIVVLRTNKPAAKPVLKAAAPRPKLKAQAQPRTTARSAPLDPPSSTGKTTAMTQDQDWLDKTLDSLPKAILDRSGSLFYSGRSAFAEARALYVLGLNPAGSPLRQAGETVARDISDWRALRAHWSAYLDESWEGKAAGTHGMQPRIRHMFETLGIDLRETPASNVVFVRSANEAALTAEKAALLKSRWPIHAAVLRTLNIRTILCLGTTSGRWVRDAIGAHRLIDSFSEANDRGWTSQAHLAGDGRAVTFVRIALRR